MPDLFIIYNLFSIFLAIGALLLVISCCGWFFLYGKDNSYSVGDYLSASLGLIIIPLFISIENREIRTAVFQSFFIFCIGGSFICIRNAFFRFITNKENKNKHEQVQAKSAHKNKRKRVLITARATAFAAIRKRLK